MKKLRLSIILVLLFLLSFELYNIYKNSIGANSEAFNVYVNEISSTKDWQDMLSMYLNQRNELINDTLNGKYSDAKKRANKLKMFECPPLINGDILLLDYMAKNPTQFANKISSVKVEYSEIRQLTKDEVTMVAKISYMENDMLRIYNYEVGFKNINGKWLISKMVFAQ